MNNHIFKRFTIKAKIKHANINSISALHEKKYYKLIKNKVIRKGRRKTKSNNNKQAHNCNIFD